jgi:hypothetical protein
MRPAFSLYLSPEDSSLEHFSFEDSPVSRQTRHETLSQTLHDGSFEPSSEVSIWFAHALHRYTPGVTFVPAMTFFSSMLLPHVHCCYSIQSCR